MHQTLRQIVNRTRAAARAFVGKPPSGRIVEFDPNLDTLRTGLTIGLTPKRLASVIKAGDDGSNLTEALSLFDEMERSDPRFFSVASTRRLALTGLDWEVVSAAAIHPNIEDKNLADEAATLAHEKLDRIDGFSCALEHLATAIGPNLAVLESIWESLELVEINPVPHWRLTLDLRKSTDIRIITAEERLGMPAEPPKFVVHIPNAKSGSPIASSIARAQALLWLIKRLALADWATFVELFGMPVRIGTYRINTTSADKKNLMDMMKNLGSSAYAAISEAVKIEFIESSQRSIAPYEALMNFCTRETGILWLGGNLTSDTTGGTGTFAAAEVQDRVREDIRDDDIKREGRTVRDQIIRPIVALAFPGRDVPLPYFRRIKPETVDRIKEGELMFKAQQIGMDVPESWARDRLGIPKPKTDENGQREAVLEGSLDAFAEGLNEGVVR